MSNGDMPMYDRLVRSLDANTEVKNADEYLDWLELNNPLMRAIRNDEVEMFGQDMNVGLAEPKGFSDGYGAPAKGNAYLGDSCQSNKPDKGCKVDTGLVCGM